MALYQDWTAQYEQKSEAAKEEFFNSFLVKETAVYKSILSEKMQVISGTLTDLAQKFKLTDVEMAGFLDGISESVEKAPDVEHLEPDTQIDLNIDFEKLYLNMLQVPADWLYDLAEWDNILPKEQRDEISRNYKLSKMAVSHKVGRNEPCPCGSGKKYKNCCDKG